MRTSKTKILLPIIGGILLIAAGVVFLLNNLGVITLNWGVVIGPLFALGGIVFLLVFILNTDEWWALIPGFVLIGIGVIIFTGENMEDIAGRWSGVVFLGLLGLAFLLIYITHRDHWWAIIPAGVLLTLAVVTLLPEDGLLTGAIFFLGLALTFGLVYILPKPAGKLTWALYPAGVLLLVGILTLLGATNLMGYVGPLFLLVAGGYVLYRALRK